MKTRLSSCISAAAVAAALLPWICRGADDFRAGAARLDITPPIGTPMAGFYSMRASLGVIDPLYANAIVVEQGGAKAAFVALDVAYTPRTLVVATRRLITEQTGITGERVMISATHTHSGPTLTRDSMMDEITGGQTPPVVDYMGKLPALIAKAVASANAKLAPANASVAMGREEHLSFNRRFVMKDGSYSWQGPRLSPNIARPAGPIDPDVGVWHLTSAGKKTEPLATYVNFAMHPTVMGGLKFSPDYPAYLSKRLAEYFGPDMVTFFANGCCGNINQANVQWAGQHGGATEGERVGTVLGAAVFRALPNLEPQKTFAPRVRSKMVTLQRRAFTDAEIAEARQTALRLSDPKISTPAKAKAVCILDTLAKQGVPLEVEVQAVAISGGFAIVALPGEIFVELGLALKKASPFKHTFIAELANGSIGYIPNRSAYPEGLYEVLSARCTAGSGELLVDEAVKMLKEIATPQAN
ncbi:MAG: neutral/alkaline non-lysosomal ceramidase N-terminal domain-containing protein [Verrucomicrobia bacterium]|nr:neutral/alkaline non-lysosomal ceramidase N-terminal domain-containing protein [Verrucomicrobiota bacterium]